LGGGLSKTAPIPPTVGIGEGSVIFIPSGQFSEHPQLSGWTDGQISAWLQNDDPDHSYVGYLDRGGDEIPQITDLLIQAGMDTDPLRDEDLEPPTSTSGDGMRNRFARPDQKEQPIPDWVIKNQNAEERRRSILFNQALDDEKDIDPDGFDINAPASDSGDLEAQLDRLIMRDVPLDIEAQEKKRGRLLTAIEKKAIAIAKAKAKELAIGGIVTVGTAVGVALGVGGSSQPPTGAPNPNTPTPTNPNTPTPTQPEPPTPTPTDPKPTPNPTDNPEGDDGKKPPDTPGDPPGGIPGGFKPIPADTSGGSDTEGQKNQPLAPELTIAGSKQFEMSEKTDQSNEKVIYEKVVLAGTEYEDRHDPLFIEGERSMAVRYHKTTANPLLNEMQDSSIASSNMPMSLQKTGFTGAMLRAIGKPHRLALPNRVEIFNPFKETHAPPNSADLSASL